MTCEEMVKKCINKDPDAWNEFIRHYKPLVVRSVKYKLNKLNRRFLKGRILDDIVQEIFLMIWQKNKLKGIRDTSCLKGWLAIVSINTTSSYCRKHVFRLEKNTYSLDEAPYPDSPDVSRESMIASSRLDTGKMLRANEFNSLLDTEISKLSDKQQVALKFNIYENKKQKDIAEIMNIPEGTVATLISRGKKHLKGKVKSFF